MINGLSTQDTAQHNPPVITDCPPSVCHRLNNYVKVLFTQSFDSVQSSPFSASMPSECNVATDMPSKCNVVQKSVVQLAFCTFLNTTIPHDDD